MAAFLQGCSLLPRKAATHTFPPLRHGIKAVFGEHGNDHGGDFEKRIPQMIELIDEARADSTRVEARWVLVEARRGEYDWTEYDKLIGALHEGGIEPMLMMYCPPRWAQLGPPEDVEYFKKRGFENLHTVVWAEEQYKPDLYRFAKALAERYRKETSLFEFWNEPDGMGAPIVLRDAEGRAANVRFGGDPVRYAEWLKVFYEGVKAGNPRAQVAAGSVCEPYTHFIEAIYASGAGDYFDAVSVHPYPWKDSKINLSLITGVREVMVRYGDWRKPIWVTEFGWSTGGDLVDPLNPKQAVKLREQAARINPMFESVHGLPYVTHFFYFTLNDWGWELEAPGQINGFGIVDFNLNKKPAFDAYQKAVVLSPDKPRKLESPGVTICGPPLPIDVRPGERGEIEVTVVNPDYTQEVTVRAECEALTAPVEVTKRCWREKTRFKLKLPVKKDARPGPYPLTLTANTGARDVVQLTVPAVAKFESGDASNSQPDIETDTFCARFSWSEKELVLHCEVDEAEHTAGKLGRDDLWKFDSLQLAVDPLRDAVREAYQRPDDSECLFALAQDGPAILRSAALDGKHVGVLDPGKLSVTRLAGKTIYTVRLPWADIHPGRPQRGDVIGVSLLLNDRRDGQRRTTEWGGGIQGKDLPAQYASMVLEE